MIVIWPFVLLTFIAVLGGVFALVRLMLSANGKKPAPPLAPPPLPAAASSGAQRMNDFTTVGKRLRRFKFFAFFPLILSILILGLGFASYFNHGPPMRWVTPTPSLEAPIPMNQPESYYEAIPPTDPQYQSIEHNRLADLLICSLWGSGFLALAALLFGASRKPPTKEILHLAKSQNGLLTLSEITTTLDIDPDLAARALRQLQKHKIASPRWQEIRKNLWEFPDYQDLPLDQTLELAERQGGRVTLNDLTAAGQSKQTAQQTLTTLATAGLTKEDPAAPNTAVLFQPQ